MLNLCPCGSNLEYKCCCQPLHEFCQIAPTAKDLMRSRFCAFYLKNIDYIVKTTVPAQQEGLDKSALQVWADSTTWTRLHIVSDNKVGKCHAQVHFQAFYQSKEGEACHDELSAFVKIGEQWYFLDPTVPVPLTGKKPCLCGSGEKFKACCGRFFEVLMYQAIFLDDDNHVVFSTNNVIINNHQIAISIDCDLKNIYTININIKNGDGIFVKIFDFYKNKWVVENNELIINLKNKERDYLCQIFKYINIVKNHEKRAWINFTNDEKYQWLRYCYTSNRNHTTYHQQIIIDGLFIKNKYDFLCEFAENLIGVGAYFGSDLDGFNDCFSLYGIKNLIVVWKNFDNCDFVKKQIIMDILNDNQVKIIL